MRNETLATVRRNALRSLMPPPRLTLSEWIEREIRLPPEVTALPGPIRLYPPQRGIADAMSDPKIERVTVVKSARLGYTTLLVGLLGSHVANEPAPLLCVLPTEDDCRSFVVSHVEPTFEASPGLAGALAGETGGESRNTLLSRRFPGGSLKVVAAKAPRNLRSHNTRILIVDEADAMQMTSEGSPILLAEKRTLQFPDRKIIIGSTPTYEETSHVLRAYAQSDKRIFEVPCHECGEHHEIRWKDINWPEGEPEKACWVCPSCGSFVEERYKLSMISRGRWRATAPHVKGHAGFRINALSSSLANASWGKLAAEWLAARHDPALLMTFVNTVLAEGWHDRGDEIDESTLAARAERFDLDLLPVDVLAITAGCDVQRDRIEVTLVGWDRKGTAFVLGHRIVWGLPTDDATWRELDELLKQRFQHSLGGMLPIEASAVDSGDGETMEAVYRFCFPRTSRRVVAIKGVGGTRPRIERSRQRVQGGWLWIVGVDGIKSHLIGRLTRSETIRFSDSLQPSYYEQLTAERVVVRYSRGQPFRRFERIPGRLAEGLDCTVYAFAVRELISPNWSAREEELKNPALARQAPARPRTIESAWLQR